MNKWHVRDHAVSLLMDLFFVCSAMACALSSIWGYCTIALCQKGSHGSLDRNMRDENLDDADAYESAMTISSDMVIESEISHADSKTIVDSYHRLLQQELERYGLSHREQKIAFHIISMKSNKAIAQSLFLSTSSIKNHIRSIFDKTHSNSREEFWSVVNLGLFEDME